jgi:two-component system, OmpR family, response regulator
MRILLIEDDEDVGRLITIGMEEADHRVTYASDGDAGMAHALAEPFDVMIFDRQLPGGIDGANLLKELRERRISTPVLFLSALGELHDWMTGLDSGGDDYIVKPFVFTELLNRVEALHVRHLGEQQADATVR